MLFRLLPAVALVVLAGCGGSSSSSSPTTPPVQTAQQVATAIVNVNVTTGQVTVTTPRTVFTGPSVSMKTSVLVNLAGSPGQKATSVTLTNNSTVAMGVDPNGNANGVAVMFGAFTTTGGSSTDAVTLSNPTGTIPNSAAGANLPYILYPGQLAASKTTVAQNWNFTVPSGVTAFSVPVTIEADNPYLAQPPSASGLGSASAFVRTFAGNTINGGFQNGTGSQAEFDIVVGIACDRSGNLYVSDYYNRAIRRITPGGVVSTIAGNGFTSGSTDGYGNLARFSTPEAIAVSADGSTVFVADYAAFTIRRIAFKGGDPTNSANWYVTTICGINGTAGGNYSNPTRGDTATLNYPLGLALDSSGNLFICESGGNRIRELIYTGGDPASAQSWMCTLLAGDVSAVAGAAGDTDGYSTGARFNNPTDIAVDNAGKVYVSDSANYRIRVVTYARAVTTLAGGVSGDSPNNGYVDGPGATARFGAAYGITVDPSGMVYICDTGNDMVRAITPAGNVTTVAGTHVAGTKDGAGNVATFYDVVPITESSSGTLFVGDYAAVREIEKINAQ